MAVLRRGRTPPEKVAELNGLIASLEGNGVLICDLAKTLADNRNLLARRFSDDGLHFNRAAYREIDRVVLNLLTTAGLLAKTAQDRR